MRGSLLIAVALLASATASGASFDCRNAATRVEKLICDDALLGSLDSQLDAIYHSALSFAHPAQGLKLAAAQAEWLKGVRDPCPSVECLREAYTARIRVLARVQTDKAAAALVVDPQELSGQVSAFGNALRRDGISEPLERCRIVIRLLDQHTNGRGDGYGAICSLGGREILICDDTMIGKLTLKMNSVVSGEALLEFTQANCPPGG